MTIWLLALILLGCLAAVGYNQGAIRTGISLVGIVLAALLAVPLAKIMKPIVGIFGVTSPIWLWVLAPFLMFVVINVIFKIIAFTVHQKVDVYYKYKAGDLREALWKKLNARLGACVGLLNALAYLVLLSWVVLVFSYWTFQISTEEGTSKTVRLLNKMGQDLQSTGMAKVARAIDRVSPDFYEMADFVGLIYHNPLAEARLSRYPAFLSIAERPDFQTIAQDKSVSEMRLRNAPLSEVLANASVQGVTQNPETLRFLWAAIKPDLKDVTGYLETGKSARYEDRLLGRWMFDVNAAMMAFRRSKPNTASAEMLKIRTRLQQSFTKTMLIAGPDGKIYLKNHPLINSQGGTDMQNIEGQWQSAGNGYRFTLGSLGERQGKIEGGRLLIPGEPLTLVFAPED